MKPFPGCCTRSRTAAAAPPGSGAADGPWRPPAGCRRGRVSPAVCSRQRECRFAWPDAAGCRWLSVPRPPPDTPPAPWRTAVPAGRTVLPVLRMPDAPRPLRPPEWADSAWPASASAPGRRYRWTQIAAAAPDRPASAHIPALHSPRFVVLWLYYINGGHPCLWTWKE